ncbi:bone morphogenetic protein 1 [Trichonephila clavipes]|nr:bone morphogenetic protein 1 [Trichonephila clavipes]
MFICRAQPSHFINLTFQDFDIAGGENCQYDYLAIYDGDKSNKSNLIGRFCNTKKPPTEIVSSWNWLLLEFSSDAEGNGRGFALKYASKSFQMPADIHVYDLDGKHLEQNIRRVQNESDSKRRLRTVFNVFT